VSHGDLTKVNQARLKLAMIKLDLDIHEFKQSVVGGAGGE
jgi:hypothetical protein